MDNKGKMIFIMLNLVFLLSLIAIGNVTAEPLLEQETEELHLWLGYDNEPHINAPTWINFDVNSLDKAITFSLELRIENSTHVLVLYDNASIYLDSINSYFYHQVEIKFNKTEQWNISLTAVTTTANVYVEEGQLQASPFELDIWLNYDTYAYEPTQIDIEVYYYDYGTRNIDVEVLLDDSYSNTTIFLSPGVSFPGTSPPEYWSDSFSKTYTDLGYYQIWLLVYDGSSTWTTRRSFDVSWFEINVNRDPDLYIENDTTISFEINSSIPSLINVDIYMYIEGGMGWTGDEYFFNQTFFTHSTTLDGSLSEASFSDSVYVAPFTFTTWGYYDIVIKAIDTTNNKETEFQRYLDVHEEVEIQLEQEREIKLEEYNDNTRKAWLWFEVGYMGTKDVNVVIELLLDDGISNTTLYYNESHSFVGQAPYSFNHDYENRFQMQIEHIFTKRGYYDVWVLVHNLNTGELLNYRHCWFNVEGKEFDPPVIEDVEGLTDGATYSGTIDIEVTVTDESIMEYVKLLVTNENSSDSMYFDELLEEGDYWYATLSLETADIYDGEYKVKIEAKDEFGNIGTADFDIKFKNGNIYVLPEDDRTKEYDEEDRITPGFEGLILLLSILSLVSYSKHRK